VFGEEKPVMWWRCVELESNGVPYDLVVWTDPEEQGGYGLDAGNRFKAVVNVSLQGRGGGKEQVKLYPAKWFLDNYIPGCDKTQKIAKEAVESVADVARLIAGGEYKEKTRSR
ncbi:MAG: hypothetical protein WAV56_03920, partial [Microgenomates group bacterium]